MSATEQAGAAAGAGAANAGANNAGAGAGTPPASGQGTAPAGASAADWTTGLNDDLKGFVQNKGFKDTTSVLESYRNFEKLMGAPREKILRLPDNMEDPNAMGEIYAKLGRPTAADQYKIDIPKEIADPELAKWMQGTFFENGLTAKQAEGIVKKWTELQTNNQKASVEKFNAELQAQETALKKEWGLAYEAKLSTAKRAAREFGVGPEVIDKLEGAMGFSGVMKFFDSIGSKIGEAPFHSGDGVTATGALTPEMARNKIQTLRGDPEFAKRLIAKDPAAMAEWERAHKMAYPDT